MSSKGSHNRITVAKHVYLRTQQRRLRHVKCVVIRNLTLPESLEDRGAQLSISVYFTLHPLYDESKVLYQSDPVCQSYNSAWESVQFSSSTFGKHSSLHIFTIKVWVQLASCSRFPSPLPFSRALLPGSGKAKGTSAEKSKGEEEEEEEEEEPAKLAFEGTIDLSDLVYLGTLVNKDGSGYPPNSVVIGMFEGYFSNPAVGGIPPSPPIYHSLVDLLPPRSLLEVSKTDVMDSYINSMLQMILSKQERLNKVSAEANAAKARVENYLKEQEEYFKKKRKVERLKMRVGLLQRLVQHRERLEKEESERDEEHDVKANKKEADLQHRQAELQRRETLYQQDKDACHKNREKLMWTRKCRTLRQRNMIYDLGETFFIKDVGENSFTICKVILPNADNLDQANNMEQYGVALGYTAHLVSQLGHVLQVPLQYPVKASGSKSTISDHISEEVVIDAIKEEEDTAEHCLDIFMQSEKKVATNSKAVVKISRRERTRARGHSTARFPLYWKGTEKALFQYAVHLLNKNIGQLRQHCGYPGSRGMLKKTLPNLKVLLDKLVKDYFVSPPPSSSHSNNRLTWSTSEPMDTMNSRNSFSSNHRLQQQGAFFSQGEFSSQSSRNSSLAITATLGLSLTPPSISPQTSLEHESFHSFAPGSSPSTPSQMYGGNNSLDDYSGGLVMKVSRGSGSSTSSKANGSVDDDFQMGFSRTRSNHVVGYQQPNAETRTGSFDSSTHEQLHYSTPVAPAAAMVTDNDDDWRKEERVLRPNMVSGSSNSTTAGDQAEEDPWLEVGGAENGEECVPLQQHSADPSRTPTPPTSHLEQQKCPKTEEVSAVSSEHTLIADSESGSQREYSISHGSSSTHTDNYTTVFIKNRKSTGGHCYDNDGEWEEILYHSSAAGGAQQDHTHSGNNHGTKETTTQRLKSATLSGPSVGLDKSGENSPDVFNRDRTASHFGPNVSSLKDLGETSLDFSNRKRSSPLVGTKELHSRRALVEYREHNLVPFPPRSSSSATYTDRVADSELLDPMQRASNSVVFSPKGFSKLSFSGEEATPTSLPARLDLVRGEPLRVPAGRESGNVANESGKGHSASQHVSDQRDLYHFAQTSRTESQEANGGVGNFNPSTTDVLENSSCKSQIPSTSQVTKDKARLELADMASSSSSHTSSRHTCSQLTGSSQTLPPSRKDCAKDHSQTVTDSSPPPPMAPTSPGPAMHFQRPRGYALKNRGMSMPHVVGVRGRGDEEELPTSTAAPDNGSSTGHTHHGFSGSDKDDQFLEDWIDGF